MSTTTEALQAMVGPGQQDVFDEFLAEIAEQDQQIDATERTAIDDDDATDDDGQPKLLAGKFRSAEELEKAYLEAQKLIGQRGQQRSEEQAPAEPAPLSREQAIEHYGDSIVTAAEEAGIDLGAWDQAVRRGDDTAELRQKLSQQTGIPAQLIEQYEAAYRPQPKTADGGTQGLTDADVVEIKAAVGGEQEFARLSQWAATNLQPAELSAYNQAVDAGNRQAVQAFLWGMQARANGGATTREPELIGGGRPPQAARFETQEQALEAMRKTNDNGKRLYNVDPKYRAWYEKTLARSTFSA